MTDVLISEYETIIVSVGKNTTDQAIISTLVCDATSTEWGAREILHLAQAYGTGILRKALALASAMHIEDGESGL